MNCEALSLSGERAIIASSIQLLLQTWNDSQQAYDTTLEDIYQLFILSSSLLQTLDASSASPVSAVAVATYLVAQLAAYRRTDVLLEMPEVNGLLAYIAQYRTLSNEVFGSLVCQSLQYGENGVFVDLAGRLAAIDSRNLSDENEMHSIAEVVGGFNFMQDEASLNTFVATHVRDYLVDTGFKQSKFHQIFVSANEHACVWGTPNYFLVKTQDNTRSTGYQPDWYWAMPAGKDIQMRYVYKRKHWDPTGLLYIPFIMPWPAGDHYPLDCNHIYYCDQELRGDASFLLGKAGSAQEGRFSIKAITSYSPYTYATFGANDPVHVTGTQTLLEIDPSAAEFSVHINAPSLSINGIAVQPLVNQVTNVVHNNFNTVHEHTQRISRRHLHTHTNIAGGDQYFHYTAPSRTIINRSVVHQLQSDFNQTVHQVVNRVSKSFTTVPSQFFTDYNFWLPRRTVRWENVTNKPDLAALYAASGHNHDSDYAPLSHHHDSDYAPLSHHHDSNYAPLSHHHDSSYYPRVDVDNLIGQRASQVFVDNALAGKANLAHQHNNYVDSGALATALLPLVDFNSLGMVLNGYEQQDSNLLRFVQFDGLGHIQVRHYANGANVDTWLPTKSITDQLFQITAQNALHHSLHMSQFH